jgi:hypothetical protein
MEAVGQLDDNHANVARHREQHLSQALRLAVFPVREIEFGELCDSIDAPGHFVAK